MFISARHSSVPWEYCTDHTQQTSLMEVTFYHGCVWGRDLQAKGAASAKALRSELLGVFATQQLAGVLWLVDKERR